MEQNEDKIFYIDFDEENSQNIINNNIYNSIFHNNFIAVNNYSIYIIIIKNGQQIEKVKCELNNKEGIKLIYFSKNNLYILTDSKILYLEHENKINFNNFNINNLNILPGIISQKQITQISCSIDETLFLTKGGMVYYQKNGEINQKLLLDLLEYSTKEIYSGENFHVINCQKRNEDNKDNYILSWGDNSCRQCGINDKYIIEKPTLFFSDKKIKKISLGKRHTCILLDKGNLFLFGDNTYNQCKINTEEPIILFEKKKVNFNYFLNNNEKIVNIKTSGYSTMIISEKGTILFLGKIVNNEPIIFQKKKQVNDKISFSDENIISLNESNNNDIYIKLNNIEIKEEEIIDNLNEINKDDFSYNTLLTELNSSNLNSTYLTENSISDLRKYINFLNLTLSSNYNRPGSLSFRPENLSRKSKEEEEEHSNLIYKNRKMYQNQMKVKHFKEKQKMNELKNKYEKEETTTNFWIKEIIPNLKILNSNKNFKKYFYKGIPRKIRGKVWMLCIGNKFSITKDYYNIEVIKSIKLLLKQNKNKKNKKEEEEEDEDEKENIKITDSNKSFEKYIIKTKDKEKSISLIDLDIERTFYNLGYFKNNSPESEDLREILRAFVISRPDIGYVQGLSYLAATLILNMDKFQSFICLMNITLNPAILPFYILDETKIKERLDLFLEIFYCNLPRLYNHFMNLDIIPEHFIIEWFMTIYSRTLNIELTLRIWDIYMIEGICVLYKTAIVILNYFEKKFLKMDFEEIIVSFQELNNIKLTEDEFVDNFNNVKFTDKIVNKIQTINDDYFPG